MITRAVFYSMDALPTTHSTLSMH